MIKKILFGFIFKLGFFAGRYLGIVQKKLYTIKFFYYSGWVASQLGNTGNNFSVIYPASIRKGGNVSIGDNFNAGPRLRIETYPVFKDQKFTPKIKIGNNVKIGWDFHLACIDEISIGNNVLVASRVYVSDHFHGESNIESLVVAPAERHLTTKGPVVIEDDVWIGEGVAIFPGVRIGKGAIIGANAVVNKDIPMYSIAAGVPAKVIKVLNKV